MTRRKRSTPPVPQAESGARALDPSRLDDVAGHRIVRRLAAGTRATLLLARASGRGEGAGSSPRILKIFTSGTSSASIDVEVAALSRAATPHVVRLLDVASIDEGGPPCLVLERLSGPSLSTYLGQTSALGAGQAVTILAPLCSTLQALHDAGVTHGAIHLRRIVFDHRGAPTLTGFGRGVLRHSPDALHSAAWPGGRVQTGDPTHSRETLWRDAVAADQHDLLDVVDEVLARVEAAQLPADFDMADLSLAIREGPSREFLSQLERALFAIAPPQIVAIAPGVSEAESRAPAYRHPATTDSADAQAQTTEYDWSQQAPVPLPTPSENRFVAALRVLGVSSTGLELASSVVDGIARFTHRQRPQHTTPSTEVKTEASNSSKRWGRRPVLVGALCAVLATTALLLVLPSPNDGAQAGAETSSSRAPSDDIPHGDPAPPANPQAESTLRSDDPAAALRALSLMNDGCAAAAEPEVCLATVFQREYLESQQADDPPPVIEAGDAVVTGSWGGSALVAARLNGQPASFLLMKGEAGWRVRDVFVSDQ
ncbi:protein kinase [Agreia bicolorata]|uniref:Protein kinase domain-containing protein n=1 Tax=Agreia bicolorata TaxID=110935 RepID=A0ABR5CIS5_9MICO|nr:protein kinase [Agreia bicolorata]KJC65407.1 hypothetical protein TZ00_00525 [Agreia bicolorata]